MLFRHEEENQSLCREFSLLRDQEGTRFKGWIQSKVRFGRVSDRQVCNQYGRYSIEVQVQSVIQDQTVSWIRIVNVIDKFVREAMPIQEEEKGSWKPAAKARPILKPSSTSGWDFTPVEQDNGLTLKHRNPRLLIVFQMSKFITRSLSHSQKVYREEDGGVHYDQVIDECKKKQFDNTEYWSVEMNKEFVNAPHWSIEKIDISSGKRWRTKEKVSMLSEPIILINLVPSNCRMHGDKITSQS